MNRYISSICVLLSLVILLLTGSLAAQNTRLSFFPIFAYSQETRLMGGAFGTLLRSTEKDSLNSELLVNSLLIYTANKQFQLLALPQLKLRDSQYRLGLDLRSRNWPDKFYGIGNNTDEDNFEQFTQRRLKAALEADIRIWNNLYAGATAAFIQEKILGLNPLNIPLEGEYHGLGSSQSYLGVGSLLRMKNTDNDQYPSRGIDYSASYTQYLNPQNDYPDGKFGLSKLELSHYMSPVEGSVIALQSSFMRAYRDVPFSFLPELGGSLRAYDSKRFINNVLLAQRAELRIFPAELPFLSGFSLLQTDFFSRGGFVLFSEVGQVAGEEKELGWRRNHFSQGFGLRYSISKAPKLNVRADFAFGDDGFNFLVQGSEAF